MNKKLYIAVTELCYLVLLFQRCIDNKIDSTLKDRSSFNNSCISEVLHCLKGATFLSSDKLYIFILEVKLKAIPNPLFL